MTTSPEQPPPLLPPPPRRVVTPAGLWVGTTIGRLVVLPFILVAVGLTLAAPARSCLLWFGRPVTATVDGVDVQPHRGGPRTRYTYAARFHYALAGRTWADDQSVDAVTAGRLHAGDRAAGRAAVVLGHAFAVTDLAGPPARQAVLLAAAAGLFDAFAVLAFRGTYLLPWQARRLLRTGTAVAGELTGTQPLSGRGGRGGRVRYRFPTPAGPVYATQWATDIARRAAYDGRPVTVVYDPARPTRSVAVELSGYKVG